MTLFKMSESATCNIAATTLVLSNAACLQLRVYNCVSAVTLILIVTLSIADVHLLS